jgi:hypothetical protein
MATSSGLTLLLNAFVSVVASEGFVEEMLRTFLFDGGA